MDIRTRDDKVRLPLEVYWSVAEAIVSVTALAGLAIAVLAWPLPPQSGIDVHQLIVGVFTLAVSVWVLAFIHRQRNP